MREQLKFDKDTLKYGMTQSQIINYKLISYKEIKAENEQLKKEIKRLKGEL